MVADHQGVRDQGGVMLQRCAGAKGYALGGVSYETFPSSISASGSGSGGFAGRVADCKGASLSVAAHALDRWRRAGRRVRHLCAYVGTMAIRTAWPTIRH